MIVTLRRKELDIPAVEVVSKSQTADFYTGEERANFKWFTPVNFRRKIFTPVISDECFHAPTGRTVVVWEDGRFGKFRGIIFVLYLLMLLRNSECALCAVGFISIDCGAASDYKDGNGIKWVTDAGFIKTGVSATIQIPTSNISLQSRTVRYFPGARNKNCYVLPGLIPNNSYLVRASFLYGNYDNKNYFPIIDVLINAAVWTEVKVISAAKEALYEIYLVSPSDSVSLCLARSGSDIPFISSLLLRPLFSNMTFQPFLQAGFALYPIYRLNYGASSPERIRYPYDRIDRIWYPDLDNATNTTHAIKVAGLSDVPPSKVLQTAYYVGRTDFNLTFAGLAKAYYHVVLYFAEIGNVTRDGQRVFDIYLSAIKNGTSPWYSGLDIFRDSNHSRYSGMAVYGVVENTYDSLTMKFVPRRNSTFGPILAAVEISQYSNAPLPVGTYPSDVEALALIQADFNLTDWSGDPCLPSGYAWNWIVCSITIPRRVNALLLSKINLQGKISPNINLLTELIRIELDGNQLTGPIPDFSGLSKLETLDLQNNNLTGPIPAYLAKLISLSQLYVQNNNLSGDIPAGLIRKERSGSLNFQYGGNPGLPCGGSSSGCAPTPSPAYSPPASTPTTPNSTESKNIAGKSTTYRWSFLAAILVVSSIFVS